MKMGGTLQNFQTWKGKELEHWIVHVITQKMPLVVEENSHGNLKPIFRTEISISIQREIPYEYFVPKVT